MNKSGFALWFAKVNAAIAAKCGMDASDLPDCDFMSWFEDGMAPKAAANKAIKNAGGF